MVDVEEKVEYKVEKRSAAEHDIANAADKVKAGAKATREEGNRPRQRPWNRIIVQKEKENSTNFFFYCIYIII